MISNAEIRGRTFRRVKKNYWFLFLIGLVPLPVSFATYAIRELMPKNLGSALSMLVAVLVAPLTYGAYSVFLEIWHKKKPTFLDLFTYIHDWRLLGLVMLLALVHTALTGLLTAVCRFFPDDMLWVFVRLFLSIIEAWLGTRLCLSPYLFILQRPQHPLYTIKDSFRRMRGYVWRSIRLSLSMFTLAIIPLVAAVMAVAFIFPLAPGARPGLNSGQQAVLTSMMSFFISFVAPFIGMASAGFADVIIDHTDDI